MPTILAGVKVVGTLRFAHPTHCPPRSVARMSEAISGTFIAISRISLRSCGLQADADE